jgi:hypothetical protein
MHYLYISLLLVLLVVPSRAQRITNVQAQLVGDYVSIQYDLAGEIPGQVFEVSLYSSQNEFSQPLKQVRGAVGPDITPGREKAIEWGAQKELTRFTGEVTFEVRANLTFSPIAIGYPQVESVFRRGHAYKLQWKGGLAGEKLRLELIRDGFPNQVIDNVANTGTYSWRVAEETPIAENYRLKITAQSNNVLNTKTSDLFAIKRRIPLVAKFIPAGILVGAVGFWAASQLGGPDTEDPILPPPDQEGLQ